MAKKPTQNQPEKPSSPKAADTPKATNSKAVNPVTTGKGGGNKPNTGGGKPNASGGNKPNTGGGKPSAPWKGGGNKPGPTGGKPDAPWKGGGDKPNPGGEKPQPLKPVGKNLHWLADSQAREVLRLANHTPWLIERGEKQFGSIKKSLQFVKAVDTHLEEDELRQILTLTKSRGLMQRDPELPDPDETVAMNAFYNEWAASHSYDGENPEEAFRQWLIEEIFRQDRTFEEVAGAIIDNMSLDQLTQIAGTMGYISRSLFSDYNIAQQNPDLVMLDLGVFSTPEQLLSQLPDASVVGGRPVIFLMHGLGATSQGSFMTYEQYYNNYREQWEGLPLEQRPIIVGVSWDSQGGILAIPHQGELLGSAINSFQQANQESSLSLVAHSLGSFLAANVVENSTVRYDEVLLLQGTLTQEAITNPYDTLIDSDRVNNLIVTYNNQDGLLSLYNEFGDPIANESLTPIGKYGLQNPNASNLYDYYFELLENNERSAIHSHLEDTDPTVKALMECMWLLPPDSTIEAYARCVEQRRSAS